MVLRYDVSTGEIIRIFKRSEFLIENSVLDGKITHAGMLFLGNSDFEYIFQSALSIMWALYGADVMNKDYVIFKILFINVVDKMFAKV